MQAVRSSVLQHVRVAIAPLQGRTRLRLPALLGDGCWRWFAVESHASGTYLDKNVVAERIISVVKKMQKVDASKVCLKHHHYRQTCNDSFVFSLLHLSLRLLPFLFLFYRVHSSASSICLGCKELLGKAKQLSSYAESNSLFSYLASSTSCPHVFFHLSLFCQYIFFSFIYPAWVQIKIASKASSYHHMLKWPPQLQIQ
jgi:hypothetical protein